MGPSILWPLNARKSQSSSATETPLCGTSCAASTATSAPTACAASTSWPRGVIVPRALDIPVTRQDLGLLVQQRAELREVELPVVGEGDVAEDRAGHLRRELPGDDVRVVLHIGEQDLVALLEELPPPALRDEVQRFGGPAREHDRARIRSAEEAGELGSCSLEGLGRLLTERVDPAVGIRVVVGVEVGDGVDDLPGLLGRGGGVQVDQRVPVDDAFEDREVAADPLDVKSLSSHPVPVHRLRLRPFLDTELLADALVSLLLELARELGTAGPHDTTLHHHVDPVGGDVVEDPLVVGDQQDAQVGSDQLRHPPATSFSESMSRPESVSSRIAISGCRTASWRISLRFFSPPENPWFT